MSTTIILHSDVGMHTCTSIASVHNGVVFNSYLLIVERLTKLAPLSQPMRSETKTKHDLLAGVFLCLLLVTCIKLFGYDFTTLN